MKILIVSDSHNNDDELQKLVKINPNMNFYLHAGDSCSLNDNISPFISVKGNCDYFSNYNEEIIIETPLGRLLMKHINNLSTPDLKKKNIKFFIYGHTHVRSIYEVDGVIKINPGSITYPRDNKKPSYVILEINNDSYKCVFKEID